MCDVTSKVHDRILQQLCASLSVISVMRMPIAASARPAALHVRIYLRHSGADPGLTVGGCLGYRNSARANARAKILCHAHFLRHFRTHERIGIVAVQGYKTDKS